MPNRVLREGITTSEALSAIRFEAEALFYRLLVVADDFGLFDGRPVIIRSRCMPLRDVTLAQIDEWLGNLAEHRLLIRYERDGKPYIAIPKMRQRTRAKASRFPLPSDDWLTHDGQSQGDWLSNDGHMSDTRRSRAHGDGDGDGDVFGDGDEGGDGRRRKRPASRGTRLPADWKPTELEMRWAVDARPDLNIRLEVDKFRDYWLARTGEKASKADWPATWRNWVRNAHGRPGAQPPASGPQRRLREL